MIEIEEARERLRDSQAQHSFREDGDIFTVVKRADVVAILSAYDAAVAARDAAIIAMVEYAREAGEAKGRLEGSEAAGAVDIWREHAQAAEARADRMEKLVESAKTIATDILEFGYASTATLGRAREWLADVETR